MVQLRRCVFEFDNYPTTNLEAIACGTPVITYNTGGSPESAKYYGMTVGKGNLEEVADIVNKEQYKNCRKEEIPDDFISSYLQLYSL